MWISDKHLRLFFSVCDILRHTYKILHCLSEIISWSALNFYLLYLATLHGKGGYQVDRPVLDQKVSHLHAQAEFVLRLNHLVRAPRALGIPLHSLLLFDDFFPATLWVS